MCVYALCIYDNDNNFLQQLTNSFCPSCIYTANYKYSLKRRIGTYLQISSCFRFSSDSVGFLHDPSGPVLLCRFVGSHPEGPVSQHLHPKKDTYIHISCTNSSNVYYIYTRCIRSHGYTCDYNCIHKRILNEDINQWWCNWNILLRPLAASIHTTPKLVYAISNWGIDLLRIRNTHQTSNMYSTNFEYVIAYIIHAMDAWTSYAYIIYLWYICINNMIWQFIL